MLDFDNPDVQCVIGKCLSKIWADQGLIITKLKDLIKQSGQQSMELNSKRNVIIYIY